MNNIFYFSFILIPTVYSLQIFNPINFLPIRDYGLKSFIENNVQLPLYTFLPETMTPMNYHIEVTPYFADEGNKSFTFDGITKFEFTVNEEKRNTLRLHAERLKNINVLSVTDLNDNAEIVKVIKTVLTESESLLTISFDMTLKKNGNYLIEIEYQGEISEDFSGMYRSSFVEDGNVV